MPRLSHFIREHREEILTAWEGFARDRPSTASMDIDALRDHAGAMLDAIARDLETPETEQQLDAAGSLEGAWDRARLAQAFGNLVGNAAQHGAPNEPIRVVARGDEPCIVTVSITNGGTVIPGDQIGGLFDAMKSTPNGHDRRHLGLGLYIVAKIIEAHGGSIDVCSSEAEGTTFLVSLPRRV